MEEKIKEKTKEKTQEAKEITKENRLMKTVEDSRTEQVHLIMHQHLNAGGRLFGGMLMQWVDEVSGVVDAGTLPRCNQCSSSIVYRL